MEQVSIDTIDSNDENRVLAENFEKMRHTIKQYTDNLETMVAQRTRELNETMGEPLFATIRSG